MHTNIYICVCVYVCMYICMYVCVYMCVFMRNMCMCGKCRRMFPALIRAREHKRAASILMRCTRMHIHTYIHAHTYPQRQVCTTKNSLQTRDTKEPPFYITIIKIHAIQLFTEEYRSTSRIRQIFNAQDFAD